MLECMFSNMKKCEILIHVKNISVLILKETFNLLVQILNTSLCCNLEIYININDKEYISTPILYTLYEYKIIAPFFKGLLK